MRTNTKINNRALAIRLGKYFNGNDVNKFNVLINKFKKYTKSIFLDFEELDYISVAGYRSLLKLRKEIIDSKGNLLIVNPRLSVETILKNSSFYSLFEIVPSISDAISKLSSETKEDWSKFRLKRVKIK